MKKIDLSQVMSGEYKETITVFNGLSLVLKPLSMKERQDADAYANSDFSKLENRPSGESEAFKQIWNTMVGRQVAGFAIKSSEIYGKNRVFTGRDDVIQWLDSLPHSMTELIITSVTQFVINYRLAIEAEWSSDPFDLYRPQS